MIDQPGFCLDTLNSNQRQAVIHESGPLLVIAGAGSGKTRVLTYRIAYLITTGRVTPDGVLAITFTNKAARELTGRLRQLLGDRYEGMWVGTFHSVCVRMLRAHARLLGLTSGFLIADAADQAAVIRDVVREFDLPAREYSPARVGSKINRAKDELLSPELFLERAQSPYERNIGRVFSAYEDRLRRSEMLDFGDLIAFTVSLLEDNPLLLQSYTDKFKHILVDEYQDTNHAQYVLTRLLAGKRKNLVVVGDDDQSIYGWRGADISNILDFEHDYPDASTIVLDANYRSTSGILDVANCVIARNRDRKEKQLVSVRGQGDKVHLYVAEDQVGEALFVIDTALNLITEGMKLRDMAVLYRSHAQSRIFEDVCMKRSVPYVLVAGTRFYERKEIKDLIAYLRVSVATDDNVSIKRIANVPRRGIGDRSIEKWEQAAADSTVSMLRMLDDLTVLQSTSGLADKLSVLAELIQTLRTAAHSDSVLAVLNVILEKTDYVSRMDRKDDEDWQQRVDNIDELLTIAADYDRDHGERGISGFLEDIALMSDVDSYEQVIDRLTLMTIHAAKGLEFPIVFVVGLDENIFPHRMAVEADDDQRLEEERRLFYVAVTRAMDKLYFTRARMRTVHGERVNWSKSRFLDDIPVDLMQIDGAIDGTRLSARHQQARQVKTANHKPPAGKVGDSRFQCGEKVIHFKFGQGTVVQVEGQGDREMVTVAFPDQGIKKLVVTLARLTRAK